MNDLTFKIATFPTGLVIAGEASALLGSWYLARATVLLGVGHLWISYQEAQHLSEHYSRSDGTDG
jgi:hypothetical protein